VSGPYDPTTGVAARLAALALDRDGRLAGTYAPSDAVRCGLLVDLALAGRLELTDDSIEVDPAPVGFGPADQLGAAMAAEPERPLAEWFDDRRLGLRQVAAALVGLGRWSATPARPWRAPRYVAHDAGQVRQDLALTLDEDRGEPWGAAEAAVAVLAGTAGLLGESRAHGHGLEPPPVPEAVLAATGPVRWLCAELVEHLAWSRRRDRYVGGVTSTGGGIA